MKIVLISHHFPPNFNAGAEQYAFRVARALNRRGHDVEVATIESISAGGIQPEATCEVFSGLKVNRLKLNLGQAPNRFEWSFRNPELGKWVSGFLKERKPDIVHINSGYLLGGSVVEAAHQMGLPIVLTLHDYWFVCPRHTLLRTDGSVCQEPVPPARCVWCAMSEKRRYRLPDRQFNGAIGELFVGLSQSGNVVNMMGVEPKLTSVLERRAYLKRVLQMVDVAISPSRFLMEKFEDYGLHLRKIIHLPFGIARAKQLTQRNGRPRTPLRIGYLGQFASHKGVHLLLDAFTRIEKTPGAIELILYGKKDENDPYTRELIRMASGYPAIRFAGAFPNDDVGRILNDLDAIVVPSIWYENRPTVIVEAQAYRTPVIASSIGGIPELVEDGRNGLLFQPGSVNDLAAQLQKVHDDPQFLPSLRKNAVRIPRVADEIARLEEIYQDVLAVDPKI